MKKIVLFLLISGFSVVCLCQDLTSVEDLMLRSQYSEALSQVKSIIQQDSTNAKAYFTAGLIY